MLPCWSPLLVTDRNMTANGRCRRNSISISLNRLLRPPVVEVLNLMERNDA